MGTVTINIDDDTEKRFRKNVKMKFGTKKGALGSAVTEALEIWNREQADFEYTMKLLQKDVDRGGYTYTERGDLHARS